MSVWVREQALGGRPPPPDPLTAAARWRRQWFSSFRSGTISLSVLGIILVAGWYFLQWAVFRAHFQGASSQDCPSTGGACWAFVIARWKPWLVGGYPTDQLWRAWSIFGLFLATCAWVVARGRSANDASVGWALLALPAVLMAMAIGGGPLPIVPPAQWGGLLLSLLATLATLAISLPLGLALALGRRSELPVVRWLCAGLIESLRSVPLLGLLFVAATVLPMFLPSHWDVDLFARAMAAFALFNAAMAAEVFRGGLQAVGAGQYEAATTVGLSRWATLRLIVLPQAVSAVVPALVNLMVAVIKETTLLSVIGLSDFLGAVENGAKTPDWMGDPNILTSGHVFLAAVYLAFCWSLSRHSRRLETLP
jgi:general L-amino acid transport system permease protein